MGNSSEDKAEEKEDGWDDGLAGGHCRKSKELSLESLKMGNNSGDMAEEEEDGWDDGLTGGHCRKSKELSWESLGLKQETLTPESCFLFRLRGLEAKQSLSSVLGFVYLREKPSKREGTKQR
jgi:hypothetical protein